MLQIKIQIRNKRYRFIKLQQEVDNDNNYEQQQIMSQL